MTGRGRWRVIDPPDPFDPSPLLPALGPSGPEAWRPHRTAFEVSGTATVLLDLDGRIVEANPACETAAGHHRGRLVGRPACLLLPADEVGVHQQYWAGLAAGRRDRYEVLGALRRADGTLLEHRVVVCLVRDAAGVPTGAVGCALPYGSGGTRLPASRQPTDGELTVLALLALGRSIGQIATELGLTRRGVDYRLSRLRSKLRADGPGGVPASGAALVARAYVLGVLEPPVWPPGPQRSRDAD